MFKITAILAICFLALNTEAQHQPVFPGLTGTVLFDSVVMAYKPLSLLPQAMGRDSLFGRIDNVNDSLTCVYTGFTIWLDPSKDPTQAAFMNGGPDAINTEHTYPQSLGATGVAEGDLHHLYPARADVNADRGNSPFAEIPDDQTQNWYYLNQKLTSKPTSNIDLYSERKGDLFEPREDHKGNVARSMFYFYTMYRQQADLADPSYFEVQRQTLCEWHFLDPVDGAEWNRTWNIAQYQDGKPNPYVLDCTLAERTFCGEFGMTCTISTVEEVIRAETFFLKSVSPNPLQQGASITFHTGAHSRVTLEIYDFTGRRCQGLDLGYREAGEQIFFWEKCPSLPPGPAFCRLIFDTGKGVHAISAIMMIQP